MDSKTEARIRQYAQLLADIDPVKEGSPFFDSPHITRNRARAAVRQEVGLRLLRLLEGKEG